MERCTDCGNPNLDSVEYLETPLPGVGGSVLRVMILFCACGWSERHTSHAVPVPA